MDDAAAGDLVKTLSHPIRIGYLRLLRQRDALSPVDYSRESGEMLGSVSYHVGALRDAGVIEEAGTEQRRGAVMHSYSLTGPAASSVIALLDLLERL
jgi:DNA-binding transcriptional ArsR family regulator